MVEDEAEEGTEANRQRDDPPMDGSLPGAPPSHVSQDPNAIPYTDTEVEEDERKDREALAGLHEVGAKITEYLHVSMLSNLLGLCLIVNFFYGDLII